MADEYVCPVCGVVVPPDNIKVGGWESILCGPNGAHEITIRDLDA